jgi:hypothetical protein
VKMSADHSGRYASASAGCARSIGTRTAGRVAYGWLSAAVHGDLHLTEVVNGYPSAPRTTMSSLATIVRPTVLVYRETHIRLAGYVGSRSAARKTAVRPAAHRSGSLRGQHGGRRPLVIGRYASAGGGGEHHFDYRIAQETEGVWDGDVFGGGVRPDVYPGAGPVGLWRCASPVLRRRLPVSSSATVQEIWGTSTWPVRCLNPRVRGSSPWRRTLI